MTSILWEVLLPALVGLPMAAAVFLIIKRPRASVSRRVGVVTTALVCVGSCWAAVTRPSASYGLIRGVDAGVAVDDLSAVVLVTISAVALCVMVFASGDVRESVHRFHGLMLVFLSAVTVTVTATNLLTLLMAWEVMGATSYALIGFDWRSREKPGAGLVAFLVTRAGDLGLYVAAAAALVAVPGMRLDELASAGPAASTVMAAGLLVAAAGKAAQLPFSFWLSRAMVGPSATSALLHSAAMVAMGGYLLLRVTDLLAVTGWAAQATAWLGGTTAVLLGLVAFAQRDLKQMLAASTAAQLGFVFLAAGVGAVAAGAAHFAAHAATKALLFLLAGWWLTSYGTRDLESLRGVARARPATAVATVVGFAALAGVPPLSLWLTKDEILAVAHAQSTPLYALGLAGSAVSAAYSGRVLWMLMASRHDASRRIRSRRGVAPHLLWSALPLTLGALLLGLLVAPVTGDRWRTLVGDSGAPTASVLELTVSGVLAASVVLAVRGRSWTLPAFVEEGWGLRAVSPTVIGRLDALARSLAHVDDRLLHRAVTVAADPGAMSAARATARFEDRLAARTVSTTSEGAMALARRSERFDVSGIDGTVSWVTGWWSSAGRTVMRMQTGMVHHYYAMAMVATAVAVGALIIWG